MKKTVTRHVHPVVTRRQMLGQGLIAGGALAFCSSLDLLFPKRAVAAPSNRIPFLAIDLGGGANIAGSNVMVGKKGGQLDFLTSYDQLGLPDDMHPSRAGMLDTSMGLAFHGDSAFLRGIKSVTNPSTLANVDGFVVPGFSLDDSFDNQSNPCHWIYSWGMRGTLADLIGTTGTSSGGGTQVPLQSKIPSLRPVIVNGRGSAMNIAQLGDMQSDWFSGRGSDARTARVLKATGRMNELLLGRITDSDLPTAHKENIRRSYSALDTALKVNKNDLDPGVDPICSGLYPAITNAQPGDELATVISIMKLIMDGFAGSGAISLGGFDYHTTTRAEGEIADYRAGRVMGMALEMAARKNRDLFLYVTTDGGQNSARASIDASPDGRGKLGWVVDSGTHGASFVLVHRAGNVGRPPITNPARQYGSFIEGGGVDMGGSPVAALPDRQAAFVFANYLALHGAEGEYPNLLGTANPLPPPLNNHLFFGKMTA